MDEQPPQDLPTESFPPPPPEGSSMGSGGMPPAEAAVEGEKPRRRGRILIAGIVVFALLLGGGAAAAFFKMRGSGEKLLSKVPATSDVVFTAYLDPSAGQKANLFQLASKFPALGSEQQLTSSFERLLDQALASTGLHHSDLSWVGDQVAFVVNVPATIGVGAAPAVAVLLDTKDEGAARATIQKLAGSPNGPLGGGQATKSTIDGVDVSSTDQGAYAVFDGTVVITSTLDEMSAIIATAHGHQPALEGSSSLQAATAGLPDGKLALLYVNPAHIVSLLNQVPGLSTASTSSNLSTLQAVSGFAMTVSAQPDGVALDVQAVYDQSKLSDAQKASMNQPGHPNPLLTSIPSDALAVISGEQLDTSLNMLADRLATSSPQAAKMLEQLGVSGDAGLLSTLSGDAAIEVAPSGTTTSPGAAIVLGTKDPVTMQAALDKLAKGLSRLAVAQAASQSFSGIGQAIPPIVAPSTVGFISANPFRQPASSWVRNDYHGVSISTLQMTGAPDISYAVVNNQGVIGSSAAQVQHVIDTAQGGANISSSAAYKDALASVPSTGGSVWVDIQGIVALIRQSLPAQQQAFFDQNTLPNVAPLKALVVGSESDSNHERVSVFLKIG
jgi:hypothetical protein